MEASVLKKINEGSRETLPKCGLEDLRSSVDVSDVALACGILQKQITYKVQKPKNTSDAKCITPFTFQILVLCATHPMQ